ncbi:hypothetical protein [Fulvimarina sp. MAC3]
MEESEGMNVNAAEGVSAQTDGVANGGESAREADTNANKASDDTAREVVETKAVVEADSGEATVGGKGEDENQDEAEADAAVSANTEDEDAAAKTNAEEEVSARKGKTRAPAKAKGKADGKAKPSRVRKNIDARKAKKDRARGTRESEEEEANGKPARKTKVKKVKRESFDVDRLEAEAKERVLTSVAQIDAIGRKTAANTFDLGREFEVIKKDIPDEMDWKEAVPKLCGLSYKSADNWIKVHRVLGGRREDLIRHRVTPTVLIALTRGTPEQVDQVIGAFEAGTPMKVREVEDLVKGNAPDANVDGAAGGGLAELKALARAKATRQTKAVAANVKAIRKPLIEALEAAGTRRLKKGKLVESLAPIARIVYRDLTELVCEIDPASLSGSQALRHLPPADERWAAALKLLDHLGYGDWAEATVLKAYVADDVLPTLGFVLDGGADPAARPDEVDARNAAMNENQDVDEEDGLELSRRETEEDDDDVDDATPRREMGNVTPFVARSRTGSGNGASGPQASV